jgi:hypothetical protein
LLFGVPRLFLGK